MVIKRKRGLGMHMFADIQKQIKETKERWEKIDKLKDDLEDQIKTSSGQSVETTAKLVLLLVEQLEPMSAIDSAQFEDGLKEVLDSLTGGKKNG